MLTPADSVSFTAGIVFTPRFINGLTISVDVWDLEETGRVLPGANDVLDRELAAAQGTGNLLPGERVERDALGYISRITLPFINSGTVKANGIDFGVQYTLPDSFGTFTVLANVTWLNSYQFADAPGVPEKELAGGPTNVFSLNDGYLKWKAISRLDWNWQGIDVIGTVHYLDGFRDRTPAGREHWVKQTWTFDGQASYHFTFVAPVQSQPVAGYSKDSKDVLRGKDGKPMETAAEQATTCGLPLWKQALNNTTITVGCNNIFGQDPPKAYGFGGNPYGYPGHLYDATGRFVYVQLTKKF